MAKKIFRRWLNTLLVLTWLVDGHGDLQSPNLMAPKVVQAADSTIALQAQTGREIEFRSQNGMVQFEVEPQISKIPCLTLYHNLTLTDRPQRTLEIRLNGIQLPPPGALVSLHVETQVGDPDATPDQGNRIPVWVESIWVASSPKGNSVTFRHVFDDKVTLDGTTLPTPTGYFRYAIRLERDSVLLYTFEQEYAFLMENEWLAQLPSVPEETPGAAPDELMIYYNDSTPFQKDINDPNTWIERDAVRNYVGEELVPAMVEAFRIQSTDWGFIWHSSWTGQRSGPDRTRLSVALTDGQTWYHGQAALRANSSISINVRGSQNHNYDTLKDGILSAFHHELFHNQQRSINQHYGGTGWLGGIQGQWQFISEGTAVLASAVAQPEIQFVAGARERAYFSNANLYLGSKTIRGDIGRDFSEISPYHAALYWRFLFEQCGGLDDPGAGMQVIEQVLDGLYRLVQGDDQSDQILAVVLPKVVDQALEGSHCSVQSYDQSLDAFDQAIDALSVAGGRCSAPGIPAGCGFYDPYGLYNQPVVSATAALP